METYYTTEQVAKKLQVHRMTILRYIKAKRLNAVKLGKVYRISEKDLSTFIKDNQTILFRPPIIGHSEEI